jgi:hypothetical protein
MSAVFRGVGFGWGVDFCRVGIANVVGSFLKDRVTNYFTERDIFGMPQEISVIDPDPT